MKPSEAAGHVEEQKDTLARGVMQVTQQDLEKWSGGHLRFFPQATEVTMTGWAKMLRNVLTKQGWFRACGWNEETRKPHAPPPGLVCTEQDIGGCVHAMFLGAAANRCTASPCLVVDADEWAGGTVVVRHADLARIRKASTTKGMEELADNLPFCIITHSQWEEVSKKTGKKRQMHFWEHVASVTLTELAERAHALARTSVEPDKPDLCVACGLDGCGVQQVFESIQAVARGEALATRAACTLGEGGREAYAAAWRHTAGSRCGALLSQATQAVWLWRPGINPIERPAWTPEAPPLSGETWRDIEAAAAAARDGDSNSFGFDGGDVEPLERGAPTEEKRDQEALVELLGAIVDMVPEENYTTYQTFDTFDVIKLAEPDAVLHNRTLPLRLQMQQETRVFMDYHEATEDARARRMPMWAMDKGKPDNPEAKFFVVADPVSIFRVVTMEDPRFVSWYPQEGTPAFNWCKWKADKLGWKTPFVQMHNDPAYDSWKPQQGWLKVNHGASAYEGKHNEGLISMLVDIDGCSDHFPHFFGVDGIDVEEASRRATYALMDYLSRKLWELAGDQIRANAEVLEREYPGALEASGWAANPRLAREDWLVFTANREGKVSVHMTLRGRAPIFIWRNMVALRLYVNAIESMLLADLEAAAAEHGLGDLKETTGADFPADSPWFWIWGHFDKRPMGDLYRTTFDSGCFKSYQTMRVYGAAKVNRPHKLRLSRWHAFGRPLPTELDAFLLGLFGFVEKPWEREDSELRPLDVFDLSDPSLGNNTKSHFVFDEKSGRLIGVRMYNFASGGVKRRRDEDGKPAGRVITLRATAGGGNGGGGSGPKLIPANSRSEVAKMVLWVAQYIPGLTAHMENIRDYGHIAHNLTEDTLVFDPRAAAQRPREGSEEPAAEEEVATGGGSASVKGAAAPCFRVRLPKKNKELRMVCPVSRTVHSKSMPSFRVVVLGQRVSAYAFCYSSTCASARSVPVGEASAQQAAEFIAWCRAYHAKKEK